MRIICARILEEHVRDAVAVQIRGAESHPVLVAAIPKRAAGDQPLITNLPLIHRAVSLVPQANRVDQLRRHEDSVSVPIRIGDELAVGRVSQILNRLNSVILVRSLNRAVRNPPKLHRLIDRQRIVLGGHDGRAVRGKGDAGTEHRRIPAERTDQSAIRYLPELDQFLIAIRNDGLPVRRVGEGVDSRRGIVHRRDRRAIGHPPYLKRVRIPGRRNGLPVRRKGDVIDCVYRS